MEFVIVSGKPGLMTQKILKDVEDEDDAASKTHQYALQRKQGFLVCVFNQDGSPIAGWKVLDTNKLEEQPLDTLQSTCCVNHQTYERVKRQSIAMKKAREKRDNQEN